MTPSTDNLNATKIIEKFKQTQVIFDSDLPELIIVPYWEMTDPWHHNGIKIIHQINMNDMVNDIYFLWKETFVFRSTCTEGYFF